MTFQIGAYRADQAARGTSPAAVRALTVTLEAAAIREKPEAPFQQAKQAVDLSQAERIVSVGRGIKEQSNIALAQKLAEALGAEIAASRPTLRRRLAADGAPGSAARDRPWRPSSISRSASPARFKHLVGMKGANTIVAITRIRTPPISRSPTTGIVGGPVRDRAGDHRGRESLKMNRGARRDRGEHDSLCVLSGLCG